MQRRARIYAEICAVALTIDAYSLIAPQPDGAQQTRAIALALQTAGVSPAQIDYVSAHGTATTLNDPIETRALKNALQTRAYTVPISSSKALLGHTLGACSAVEIIKTILAMQNRFIPPTLNLTASDPACDLDSVPRRARAGNIDIALVINSSFDGKNSAVVLRRWQE